MGHPGRPTLYRRDHCELARNYCRLGATNDELAAFFEVTTRTIDNWIATHPEFATAGPSPTPGWRAASTSVRWATSARSSAPYGTWASRGRSARRCIFPPDTRACIFWLRHRQPRTWRGRAKVLAAE